MPTVYDKKDYYFGIAEIDEQHGKLLDMIARVENSLNKGIVNDEIGGIIKEMVEYTGYHFKYEEEMLKEKGYPEADKHNVLHRTMILSLIKLLKDLKNDYSVNAFSILRILKGWADFHILKEDRKYVPYVLSEGKCTKVKA